MTHVIHYFYKDDLKDFNFESKVKFKKTEEIILRGTQPEPYKRESSINSNIYALCKSNLQKCVRRSETERAVSTALAMLLLNPSDTLRRIPIIMVEDAQIHPDSFIFLVWLMCATTKGYKLSKEDVDKVLSIVADMCKSEYYEKYRSDVKPEVVDYKLTEKQEHFLWCMEVRKEYGGMWCDKDMLAKHQLIWRKRFFEGKLDYWSILSNNYDSKIDASKVEDFKAKKHILPIAMDYHVFPWLLNDLPKQSKLAIWLFVSGRNYKTPFLPLKQVTPEISELYEKIKKEYSKRVLDLYKKLIS